jgi:hypothetical protein
MSESEVPIGSLDQEEAYNETDLFNSKAFIFSGDSVRIRPRLKRETWEASSQLTSITEHPASGSECPTNGASDSIIRKAEAIHGSGAGGSQR